MGLRTWIANGLIARGRKLGRSAGAELAVKQSGHSINARMVNPNSEEIAWDHDLFRHGNLFYEGYANPVKLVAKQNEGVEDPDTVEKVDGDAECTEQDAETSEAKVISSKRYGAYMQQHLIEQLLNPREHWKMIVYAVIGLAMLQVLTLALAAAAAGVF